MKKIHLFLLVVSAGILLPSQLAAKLDQIVVIIENCRALNAYTFKKTNITHREDKNFFFYDVKLNTHGFSCDPLKANDTISIITDRPFIEFVHNFQAFEKWSFLLKKGDTLKLSYEGKIPNMTLLNRKEDNFDLRYEAFKREKILNNKEQLYGLANVYLRPFYTMKGLFSLTPDQRKKRVNETHSRNYSTARKHLDLEEQLLDSLLKEKLVSSYLHDFHKARIKGERTLLIYYEKVWINNIKLSEQELEKLFSPETDIYLPFYFHQELLRIINQGYFHKRVKTVHKPGLRIPDFRDAFDLIAGSSLISPRAKKLLLVQNLDKIVEFFSAEDIETYFKKYESFIKEDFDELEGILDKHKNEFFRKNISYIIDRYRLSYSSQYDLALVDMNEDTLSFNQIREKHRGKILYIDFWASWCGPCLGAMPSSHNLREEYQDKDFVMVYISTDQQLSAWKQAANQQGVGSYGDSYAVNYSVFSKMLSKLNIKQIPRYLLYDQEGNLIYPAAPGPGGAEIRKILDELL